MADLNPGFGEHPDWTDAADKRRRAARRRSEKLENSRLAHRLINEHWPLESEMPRIGGDGKDAKITISYSAFERILVAAWWDGKED
jgi:hypothetical protein